MEQKKVEKKDGADCETPRGVVASAASGNRRSTGVGMVFIAAFLLLLLILERRRVFFGPLVLSDNDEMVCGVANVVTKEETHSFVDVTAAPVYFQGRVWRRGPQDVEFDWPCVSWSFDVHVTAAAAAASASVVGVSMDGGDNGFRVLVDGAPHRDILRTDALTRTYALARNLTAGVHRVEVVKETEAGITLSGLRVVRVRGVALSQGLTLVGRPARREQQRRLRIEFFGDSDTNGFGNLGSRAHWWSCFPNLSLYESCYHSYAHLLGRALDAEIHVEAWSGKGITRNAADFWTPTMPDYWRSTIATNTTRSSAGVPWDFSAFSPDLVVVYLGSNDFATPPHPSADTFVSRYVTMLNGMVASYAPSRPQVLLICGGHGAMDNDPCPLVQQALAAFSQSYDAARAHYVSLIDVVPYPDYYGCIEHRSVSGHATLAEYLLPKIKGILPSHLVQRPSNE